jgi:pSer/pThr/pTyr-binding forkhead associated (FHA) protein
MSAGDSSSSRQAGALPRVTFQVLEGVDKGRLFRDLPVPITIGREEGNLLRLNDERVSRFHAKVQQDEGDLILTDLESTNGTRVNGNIVQIRRLRYGDRITVGRSMLLFGSLEEIGQRDLTLRGVTKPSLGGTVAAPVAEHGPATVQAANPNAELVDDFDFDLNVKHEVTVAEGNLYIGRHALPPLPLKMTPSQAARLSEILDFLHRQLTRATENIRANEEGTQVTLGFSDWQRTLAVQMLLARYLRAISEPEVLD